MVKTDKLADEMRELLYPHQREAVERLADEGRRWFPLDINGEKIEFDKPSNLPAFIAGRLPDFHAIYTEPREIGNAVHAAINNMQAALPRWGEADSDPLADIQKFIDEAWHVPAVRKGWVDGHEVIFLQGDLSQLEMYAFASMLHESGEATIMQIGSGSVPGMNDMLKSLVCKTEAPAKSYLDHDPTKKHRRRKRK